MKLREGCRTYRRGLTPYMSDTVVASPLLEAGA